MQTDDKKLKNLQFFIKVYSVLKFHISSSDHFSLILLKRAKEKKSEAYGKLREINTTTKRIKKNNHINYLILILNLYHLTNLPLLSICHFYSDKCSDGNNVYFRLIQKKQ